jgi:S-adenosylmethionine hydrolase
MEKKHSIITLTTDFGTRDPYVGAVKGAILTINPSVSIVDITHEIGPGDLIHAAFTMKEIRPYFPKGTIHLAVVDPGVGGPRRPLAVKVQEDVFVGPDNGIFWKVMEDGGRYKAFHLTEEAFFLPTISRTFHGRDIFAPVAGHISKGIPLERLGRPISDPIPLRLDAPKKEGEVLLGEVIRVDRFGNIITNITYRDLRDFAVETEALAIEVGAIKLEGIKKTYCDVPEGTPLAIFGSSGLLEIAVNSGNASQMAGIRPQERPPIRVRKN